MAFASILVQVGRLVVGYGSAAVFGLAGIGATIVGEVLLGVVLFVMAVLFGLFCVFSSRGFR